MAADALTPRQQSFVAEYLVDLNATAAYKRAGYKAKSNAVAASSASDLLRIPKVAAAIAAAQAARAARTNVTADAVLKRWWSLANADPNDLVEYRRTCCRCCYGAGHRHQRTAGEMERDRQHWEQLAAEEAGKPDPQPVAPFDERGGTGYDPRKGPSWDCPECFGEGVGGTYVKDTRALSPAALALYAGVKETKEGVQVLMHDQAAALVNAARHLGMFVDRHEHSGPDGGPLQHDHAFTDADRRAALRHAAAALGAGFGRSGVAVPTGHANGHGPVLGGPDAADV
jgi:phage terminase small subunit